MTEDLSIKTKSTSRSELVVQRKNEIQQQEAEIKKMLPPSVPSDKFVRTVQTAITLNPDLAEADKNSVLTSCMKAAADGLVLDGREAALTIYNTKVKRNGQETWVKMAQYIPMVAGIIKRVRNSGEVARLNAFVVYEHDVFHVAYGLEMSLKHEPNFAQPGKAIGAYAVCRFKDGEVDFEFMSVQQIEAIRERSKSKDKGPWQTDWSEMARKTVIRRLAKRLPVDSDIARVVERIDEDYDFTPSGQATTPDDGTVIDHETGEVTDKAPAKRRGAAAEKLNPTVKKPATEVRPEAEAGDAADEGDQTGQEDDFDDVI